MPDDPDDFGRKIPRPTPTSTEREADPQIEAILRWLLDEGHITPIGAREVRKVSAAHDADLVQRTREEVAKEFDRLHESDEPDPWYWSDAADRVREGGAR